MFCTLPPQPVPPPTSYLVVLEARLDGTGYARAAETLATFRDGELVRWDGAWEGLAALVQEHRPEHLALVLAPETIDANLPRRLVPVLCALDDDPFQDCDFGLITGATGDDALRFVERIVRSSGEARPERKLSITSVQVERCTKLAETRRAGGEGRVLGEEELWVTGQDPAWREFVAQWRGDAKGCGLIEWGHCGDSQGLWLFPMSMNRERARHWPYDPAKVGQDPAGVRPRLTPAQLVDGVDLYPAVVVNGACHSAVTRNTIVGGDIVSTFGDTGGKIRFHALAPQESFPLQAIAHGATAYLAPLGANHAHRAAIEEWWIRKGGIALGDVVKRTTDELVLGAAKLPLSFAVFRDGEPAPREAPMFQDCVQRVLFGDPLFLPWKEEVCASDHELVVRTAGGRLFVTLRWSHVADDPFVWDPWREERGAEQGRIFARVPLAGSIAEGLGAGAPKLVKLEGEAVRGETRTALALVGTVMVERDARGGRILHVVARGPRAQMAPVDRAQAPDGLEARFEVVLGL